MPSMLVPFDPRAGTDNALNTFTAEDTEEVKRNLESALSLNTRKAYRSDWQAFAEWCSEYRLAPVPSKPETIAQYVSMMSATGHKWATIARHISTISQAHKLRGLDSPTSEPLVKKTCQGIRRRRGVLQRRARALLPVDVAHWIPMLPDSNRTTRDISLITMGLAGGFRQSELAQLQLRDIVKHDRGLAITVRASKVDQAGEGFVKGIMWGRSALTCPVKRWYEWKELVESVFYGETPPELPAFLAINVHDSIQEHAIDNEGVCRAVRRLVELGHGKPSEYSGHSLRSGFVTSATQAGVRPDKIMAQTGHKSLAMLARYIRQVSLWEDNASGMIGL